MKIAKKGEKLPAADVASGADVATGPRRRLTWRAGPPRRYDVALRPRGRTRVAHAGRGWRCRVAGGHTDGPRGRPCAAPRGRGVRMWRAHGYSGPLLDFRGGNALGVNRPLIYRGEYIFFLPCGTMSHTGLSFAGHVDAQGASDSV